MTINELLNRYVDSLNTGTPININDLLKLCPESEQDELKQLCSIAKIYKANSPNNNKKIDNLFSHLEKMRVERLKKTYEISEIDINKVAEKKEKYKGDKKESEKKP